MSVLLAVVASTVQAVVASPTPVPTPQVVTQVVHDVVSVPTVPSGVLKAAQVALLFFAGVGGSIFHQVLEGLSKRKEGWSTGVNVALQVLYGALVAALAAFVEGSLKLNLSSALDLVASFLVVLGSSQGRYMFFKWVSNLGSDNASVDLPAAGDDSVPTKAAA